MPSPVRLSRRTTLTGLAALGAAPLVASAAARGVEPDRQEKPLIGPAPRHQIHAMTFNIRLDFEGTLPSSPDSWTRRAPAVTALLRREQPTLLGVQEAEFNQIPAITEALPHHQMVGYGRGGGSIDEYSAVFFDARRYELRGWDQTWLSDTPNVIASTTWGNYVTRIVVWARLRDRSTGRELVHVNTHLDHKSENARAKSALVVAGLRERFEKLPVLVTGDFNAKAQDSTPYTTLTRTFDDTWQTAKRRLTPEYGTFPNYEDAKVGDRRIDWVLATPGVRVHSAAINTSQPRDVWPSDHTPVQALVELD
jgi:endonuclease/exonuclease/phosphatase family metal-dependent hydrolase